MSERPVTAPIPPIPEAEQPAFDPGLTERYTGAVKRFINKNGQFNVRRVGRTFRDAHPYLYLINVPWVLFVLIVGIAFFVVNTAFAWAYVAIGTEHVNAPAATESQQFLNAFFFSAHTLTTVGYGNMYPSGSAANIVATIESLTGLMGFAIATGILFGRFSRPSARIGFSDSMVVAPYKGGTGLQLRVVNRRLNNLIELEARMTLMTVELVRGRLQRKYVELELERRQILLFPLTWTIVHPITPTSPLYGKTPAEVEALQVELLVSLKGFDDTFGQTVHARNSYRYDEIRWGARFVPAFEVEKEGDLRVEVNKVSDFEPVPLPVIDSVGDRAVQ